MSKLPEDKYRLEDRDSDITVIFERLEKLETIIAAGDKGGTIHQIKLHTYIKHVRCYSIAAYLD